jgi:hypothetical protein
MITSVSICRLWLTLAALTSTAVSFMSPKKSFPTMPLVDSFRLQRTTSTSLSLANSSFSTHSTATPNLFVYSASIESCSGLR